MSKLSIDLQSTALVVIDLQQGIVRRASAPHSSQSVVRNAAQIADRFRALDAFVVLVHVAFHDGKDILKPLADTPTHAMLADAPADWSDIVPELGPQPGDLIITKHQWGAFYGTELDLQLRRRSIKTIVLAGISTNFGVESTARVAFEYGYDLIFVEDAMAGFSEEVHRFPVENIFPRIGRVTSTEAVLQAIAS